MTRVTHDGASMTAASNYGTLGLNIGVAGIASRLLLAVFYLISIPLTILTSGLNLSSLSLFLVFVGLSFAGIAATYTATYYLLGDRLGRWNPWINTAIFVGPAWFVLIWGAIGPLIGLSLPPAFIVAMGIYVGISFILQSKMRYGGCEVVAVPILLVKRRYPTYCIPLVAVDVVEKAVIDRKRAMIAKPIEVLRS